MLRITNDEEISKLKTYGLLKSLNDYVLREWYKEFSQIEFGINWAPTTPYVLENFKVWIEHHKYEKRFHFRNLNKSKHF